MTRLAFDWLHSYERKWLSSDVIAGMTASAVVIPKSLAYATVAGLPVEAGLYTALVPAAIYAVLGSSRPLSVSTTTTLAILTGAALQPMAATGDQAALLSAAATLALLVGVILMLAGALRLGFVANFISEPVLVGFKAGIGIVIVLDQIPKLIGTHIEKASFFHNLAATVASVPHASWLTAALAGITILILLSSEHFWPRAPAPLVAVALGVGALWLFGLDKLGVTTVGQVPTGLPSVSVPDWHLIEALWPAATGIALMSFTESIAAGRAFSRLGEPLPQPNRELLATGLANLGGAWFGAMPAGGGTSQTAVNRLAGARSQLAGLITAGLALATLLLLAPLIGLLPNATLAAIVIVYSVGLVDPKEFRAIARVRSTEFLWALVALIGVMVIGTLQGIVVAIIVSLLALAYQVSDPPVHALGRKPGSNIFRPRSAAHRDDEFFVGVLIVRPEGRIFFANAERVRQKIEALVDEAWPKVVILDLSRVFDLEYTALKVLTEAELRQRELGVNVWLVGLNPSVWKMVKRSPLGEALGTARTAFNVEQALERAGIELTRKP